MNDPIPTLRDEAAAAGIWIGDEDGDFVVVSEGDVGITIVEGGNAINPADWTNLALPSCY